MLPPSQYVCNQGEYGTPECGSSGWYCYQGPSPIIIDTRGTGFRLTSAAQGVTFDIKGDGHPIPIAWTAPNSGNAFLALDRNHNGTIDSGKELFGNYTQQPASSDPNGFIALAQFDLPANGGNDDGVIDKNDAVFSQLVLWIDDNHDGISQPNELHSLSSLGLYSISLKYRESRKTDEFGNEFRDKAALNVDGATGESTDGHWAYDVFFRVLEPSNISGSTRIRQRADDPIDALLAEVAPQTRVSCPLKKGLP